MTEVKISQNILDEILNRIDIVELISSYIPLKRAGRNFKALCPFHHEKTPSFMISPQRQIYHCFGCGIGGNAFHFLMQYERLSFKEAVEVLAKKAGIELPCLKKEDTGIVNQIYKVNELACSFYMQNLKENRELIKYLLSRGLNLETIQEFKLGYAPNGWDYLIRYLREKAISLSVLEKAGLVVAKEDGGYYDRFRNRIIFPIFDIKSRIIAFGARALPSEEEKVAKYINSPETEIYIKGRNLYGINFSKDYIREKDFVIIVEGYLDFIIPYQKGFRNIVASQGTAFTPEQARLIKRYTQNIIVLFDADEAGQIATLRSLDIFIENEMNVKVVSLPQGYDPDNFVREFGIEKFSELIENNAYDFFDYKLEVLKKRYNFKEPQQKAKAIYEILVSIKKIKNSILQAEYIKKLAEKIKVSEQYIREELTKIKDSPNFTDTPTKNLIANIPAVEKLFLKLILEEQELIKNIRDKISPTDFQDERISKIIATIIDFLDREESIDYNKLMNYLTEEKFIALLCDSAFSEIRVPIEEREKLFFDCFKRIKERSIKLKRNYLAEQIKFAESIGDRERLTQLIQELQILLKNN